MGMIGPKCCTNGICGYGKPGGIVFVGIAPGRNEIKIGKPLVGPSGKLLDALLAAYDIKREDTYATNLICWYKDDPTPEEIKVCAPRLQRELNIVKPKVIVALDALACQALFGMKLGKARGAVIRMPNGVYGLATWHPAACLHRDNSDLQINASYDLSRDFGKLNPILNGDYDSLQEPSYTIITNPEEAQSLLDRIPQDTPVALDIETKYDKESDKSHPFSDAITCIGIGWTADHAYVLTPSAYEQAKLKWPTTVKYVFHNGSFDTQEIAKHLNVWLPIGEDTMLQSYSCDERSVRGLHKLKPLSREFVGADFYEVEEHHDTLEHLYEYNAKDVCYTWRLHQHLREWQANEQTILLYRNVMLPAQEMLARSQYRGIYIDPQAIEELELTLGREFLRTHLELQTMAKASGHLTLNVNSPMQIKAMMLTQGYSLASTNKATLNNLLDNEEVPFLRKLLRYRMLHKLINTYLFNVQACIMYDGRVHPHAFLTGTNTGRLTYKDPPMQTLPKPKTVGELGVIRKIFAATNPDYVLLEFDYAQIEAWVAAYLSEDNTLLTDLQSGNWHTLVTMDVFKIDKNDPEWPFYYDAGKHLNYGCLYEESPEGLTRRPPIGMGCDLATARQYHSRWHQRYHVFDEWRARVKWEAQHKGFITTPFGFKRRFPFIVNQHQLRQAVNAPIQSTANHYTVSSAIKLWPKLEKLDTHLLFLEHDAIYYEAPRANLEEVVGLIQSVMESPPLHGLPSIKVEGDMGPNLAEMGRIHA